MAFKPKPPPTPEFFGARKLFGESAVRDAMDPLGLFGRDKGAFQTLQNPALAQFIPGFDPQRDSTFGLAQQAAAGAQTDPRALEALRARGLSQSPSRFAQLRQAQIGGEGALARGQAVQQGAGAQATALGQLAARGGISGGARERLGQSAFRNIAGAGQNIASQTRGAQQQNLLSDEAQRVGILRGLPGQEQSQAAFELHRGLAPLQAKQFDVNQQVGESTRQNAFNLQQFAEQNQQRAAELQARATAESGKK